MFFPEVVEQLPIGGVTELAESGELKVSGVEEAKPSSDDFEIVNTIVASKRFIVAVCL